MTTFRNVRVALRLALFVFCGAALVGYLGCSKPGAKEKPKAAAHEGHDHAEAGPHQGQLIELGEEEYHAELVHDDANQKVTIYLLDGKAKGNVPIPASEIVLNIMVGDKPTQFKLPAVPDSSDPTGKSSRFELADKTLSEAVDAKGPDAHLNVTIEGKPYTGVIKHDEHEHHHEH